MHIFRTSALLALAALTACNPAPEEMTREERDARAPVEDAALDRNEVACALGGATAYTDVCSVERVKAKDGLMLVVRHPDGGFRRFKVVKDGRGLEVADGADKAVVAISGDRVEVVVGEDRYRFPATVKAAAAKSPEANTNAGK